MRTIVLALATLVGAAAPARADVLPQFTGLDGNPYPPGDYVPGQAFTFDLRAPGLDAFTDFRLDLLVITEGVDPVTQLAPITVAVEKPPGYVFGAAGSLAFSPAYSPGDPVLTVSISGASAGGGVTTRAGNDDRIARVVVTPSPDYQGRITFVVDNLRISALTESGQTIETPDAIAVLPKQPDPSPVPGPGGMLLLGVGGLALAARGRLARQA